MSRLSKTQITGKSSRFAVGTFFFLHGLCFSSWGVRIPDIQLKLGLSESQLGMVLFALPVGSMTAIPFSSSFIRRLGTHRLLPILATIYACTLVATSLAGTIPLLAAILVLFGFTSNTFNICVNTQAFQVEHRSGKNSMAAFHGLWSLAGFVGGVVGTGMIAMTAAPPMHFAMMAAVIIALALFTGPALLKDIPSHIHSAQPRSRFPDASLLILGVITFCGTVCEGAMFDWSGVYFEKVVHATGAWISAGYVAFLSTMAGTRLIADRLKSLFGFKPILIACSGLITLGLSIAILFPTLLPSILGFTLVGMGTSAVVPFTFSEGGRAAAKAGNRTPSSAIATISAIGFIGFLLGPPAIGWIAGATSLRVSFAVVVIFGAMISVLVNVKHDKAPLM